MNATVQTKTHHTCAAGGCELNHREAIANSARWVKALGLVYAPERKCLVVHSWAESCSEHADTVATAVAGDIEEWAERWNVETHTSD